MLCYAWVAVIFVWGAIIAAGVDPSSRWLAVAGFMALSVAAGLYVWETRRKLRRRKTKRDP